MRSLRTCPERPNKKENVRDRIEHEKRYRDEEKFVFVMNPIPAEGIEAMCEPFVKEVTSRGISAIAVIEYDRTELQPSGDE